ncbi:hypothetical protein GCM10020218_106720 [Dactylosporangium vinaceum]
MTSLRERFEDAAAAAPPSRLAGSEVYAAAWRRRRKRQGWAVAAAAGVTALLVATVAVLVPGGGARPTPANPPVVGPAEGMDSPVAGDGEKLYVQWAPFECEHMSKYGCPGRLMGSEDNGRTWTERYRGIVDQISSPAPGSLLAHFDGDPGGSEPTNVSTDGGRTWRAIRSVDDAGVAAIPPNGWLSCTDDLDHTGGGPFRCTLRGVDPETATARRLASPPPGLAVTGVLAGSIRTGLWVSGTMNGHSALAVSRDGGRHWTTHVFPATVPDDTYFSLATLDGFDAYAVAMTGEPRAVQVYRTTDAGQTWSRPPRPRAQCARTRDEARTVPDTNSRTIIRHRGWPAGRLY